MAGKIIPGLTEQPDGGDNMQVPIYNSLVAAITDRTRYITLSNLYSYIYDKLTAAVLRTRIGNATTAQTGLVERCTDTEAETGTDTYTLCDGRPFAAIRGGGFCGIHSVRHQS